MSDIFVDVDDLFPLWLGPWRIERWAHGFTWRRDRLDASGLQCTDTVTRFRVPA